MSEWDIVFSKQIIRRFSEQSRNIALYFSQLVVTMEKRPLTDEYDIEVLIDVFYTKVLRHKELSVFFSDAVKNWEYHKKRFVQFWSAQILFTDTYDGGTPLPQHVEIDRKYGGKFKKEHFDAWTNIWVETVNELYVGEKAELAKETGENMARNIYMKMFLNRKPSNF